MSVHNQDKPVGAVTKTILVFYPQMEKVIEFYENSSSLYSGEKIIPWDEYRQTDLSGERVVILGRHSNFHHLDISHIRILREKRVIPEPEYTTVVVFDWHEDLDNEPGRTELTSGSWAYLGLEQNLYSNLYIVGTGPRGIDEMNPWQCEGEIRPPTGEILKKMNRVFLFPAASSFSRLKFFPEYEQFIANNESVAEYFLVKDGGFVEIRFKSMSEVAYQNRKEVVVVSIDLDVLKRSVIRTVCPQGIMESGELIAHLRKVKRSGPINAILVCGLTEEKESQDAQSLNTLAEILSEARTLLSA